MEKKDALKLGKTVKIQGKDGEMLCHFDMDKPGRFAGLQFIFIDIDRHLIPFHIENLDLNGNYAKIKLEDVDSPEEAQALVNREVFTPLTDLPQLPEKDFYLHEIIGFTVVDKEKGEIGQVKDVLEKPEQPLLLVIHQNKELLIPLAEELITEINKKKQFIIIDMPAGLIDLYL